MSSLIDAAPTDYHDLPKIVKIYFDKETAVLQHSAHANLPMKVTYTRSRYGTYRMIVHFMAGEVSVYGFEFGCDYEGKNKRVKGIINWKNKMRTIGDV